MTSFGSQSFCTGSQNGRWYDRREVILYAFLVGLAVAVVAIVFVSLQGFALWRQAKRTGGKFSAELSSFEERSAQAERLLAEADRSSQDLEAAVARLRVSRARLEVLLGSLEAAQRRTRWLRVLLPLR
jgi:hypothetical protein